MRIGWREIALICQAALYLFAGLCIWLRHREGQKKQETFNCWPLSLFLLIFGLVFAALTVLVQDGWYGAILSLPVGYLSLHVCNQRIRWDSGGFWYRTATRREIRYEYRDITGMRRAGPTAQSRDLLFRAGGRLVILDQMQGWAAFAAAYDDWRTRSGLVPWREEEKRRWMERYKRHGHFARKLDRIWCGRLMLAASLTTGLFFTAVGILALTTARTGSPRDTAIIVVAALMIPAGIAFPAIYIWGVAHLNKRVLRFYTQHRILPDPLHPEQPKPYRRKKRT